MAETPAADRADLADPFRVLFVCVGNVCRSPLGERLAAALLPSSFEVSSAGVGALAGQGMDPDAAAQLTRLGGSPAGFVARQLTPAMVREADLVLTATTAIRSRVLEEAPTALRRTFTFRELAALLDVVEDPGAGPAELVRAAAQERSRARLDRPDVVDPYRRGSEVHAEAAAEIDAAVRRVVAGLAP